MQIIFRFLAAVCDCGTPWTFLLPFFVLFCIVLFLCFSVPLALQLCCCVEVLRPSQPNGVMSSAFSLPNHTFTGQT